jgi:hypothetical protein
VAFFRSVLERPDKESQERVTILIDAFDALKQDYLSTRYLAWLATDPESPIKEPASELSKQAVFWDSAEYARWGVATGLAGQALADAVNVLDKVASFVHLYLATSRKPTGVYFNTLWHKRGNEVMDPEIEAEIKEGNFGLLALCDLSCDHERDTPLKEFVERRHAATHRFLVVHDMAGADTAPAGEWLERISWFDLRKWLETQLRTARAALIYLARTIDTRRGAGARGSGGKRRACASSAGDACDDRAAVLGEVKVVDLAERNPPLFSRGRLMEPRACAPSLK